MMRVTVALNSAEASKLARGEPATDLRSLISGSCDARIVKVFGRGRFASIETNQEDLARLQQRIGDVCVFSPKLQAKPIGS